MANGINITGKPEFDRFKGLIGGELEKEAPAIWGRFANASNTGYLRDAVGEPVRRRADDHGPLRIVSGRLERSLRGVRSQGRAEGVRKFKWGKNRGRLSWGSKVPYAGVHEDGFRGTVNVPAHERSAHKRLISQAFGQPIEPREVEVRAHGVQAFSRDMNVPARPYIGPALEDSTDFTLSRIHEAFHRTVEML